ncbi:hypothetical protein ABEW19_28350 [Paenibacillus illinoisensis]|uniref:hypothetical protein n=1 Tax=Paenibacillus illinoisensis TaxID=59845 RepID=UPI003D26E26D
MEEAAFAQDWDDAIDEFADPRVEVVKVGHEAVRCLGFEPLLKVVSDEGYGANTVWARMSRATILFWPVRLHVQFVRLGEALGLRRLRRGEGLVGQGEFLMQAEVGPQS